jgi:hypothetical protein
MEKQNRAERRKNKFGGGRATERGGWPTVQPNPVFSEEPAPEDPQPRTAGMDQGDAAEASARKTPAKKTPAKKTAPAGQTTEASEG